MEIDSQQFDFRRGCTIETTKVPLPRDPPYRPEWTLHGLINDLCLRPMALGNPLSSLVSGQTADLRSLFGGTTP